MERKSKETAVTLRDFQARSRAESFTSAAKSEVRTVPASDADEADEKVTGAVEGATDVEASDIEQDDPTGH